MATSLFAPTAGAKDCLVEFRAGRMNQDANSKTVRADVRKGKIQLKRSADDGIVHFVWMDRQSGAVETDLMIFPDDAVFRRVKEAKTGRVYLLEFKTSSKKMFFWMQEPSEDKDEELCKKVNDAMNNPDAGDAGGAGGAGGGLGGLGGLDQAQLMQMLGGGNPQALARLQNALASGAFGGSGNSSPPSSAPSTPGGPESPSPAARPAATTTSTPAAAAAAPATGGSGGGALANQLSNVLSGMLQNLPQPPQRPEEPELNDVLATDELLKTGILSDPKIVEELQKHLPPESQNISQNLRSPQFRQAVEMFNIALSQGQLSALLQSFGLPPSSEASASNLEAFLRAVQTKAEKEKKDDDDKMDTS